MLLFLHCLLHLDATRPPSPSTLPPILLALCYPSSTGSLPISDAYQLAFTVNEIHPFFFLSFSEAALNCTSPFHHSQCSLGLVSLPDAIIYSPLSPLCALGICSYIVDLWLMSTLLFISAGPSICVHPEMFKCQSKHFEMNSDGYPLILGLILFVVYKRSSCHYRTVEVILT